ncbi:serine hydrolase domain-containing protein [Streptomyces sp. JJ36]|uniref:serine hydrolase domain-containing protein n=1 Tax=Streptomyces sp. JJ36 TaxID=2736645 RepID=UPI001F1645E3|nr:serine hydrolase domain-containing protein [Streptomyces sp. JJ36]MCF6521974.1 serine hydrolase [Streptomyces sp. JJ36]
MRRRQFLGTLAAGTAAAASPLGTAVPAGAAPAPARGGPPTVTAADLRFRPRTLRPGSAHQAGLLPEQLAGVVPAAAEYTRPGPDRPHPSHPGFVLLAARDGVIAEHAAHGHALRYERWDADAAQAVELPREQWEPMRPDTVFDMASVSKLFTSVVLTILAERGDLDLSAPVARYLPPFAAADPAKAPITVRQLLTHTSGMKPWISLAGYADREARLAAVYAEPLVSGPGTAYAYSDLNLITAGRVAEEIAGKGLDALVAELITGPLGMRDTGYNPPAGRLHRIAATEYQPWTGRGMVRGTVHDENAWYLGGVAGHAGIFSTAADMAVFGQTVLNGGVHAGTRLLREDTVRTMLTNHNAHLGGGAARGLGWQLDQRWYMDALTSPVSFGHTGYTGTCLVGDPLSGTLFVLLTNRVHPTREWGTVSDYRRAPARRLARALPVRPRVGRSAWFSGQADGATATLRVPLAEPVRRDAGLRFRLWYDTEASDVCTVQATTDGGTTWQAVPLELRQDRHRWHTTGTFSGFARRRWTDVRVALPDGVTGVRWRYATDPAYQGRGVYVQDIRVLAGPRPVFLSLRPRDNARIRAEGWAESRN